MASVLSGRLTSVQARIALTAGLCLGQTKAALENRAATGAAAIKAQLEVGLDTEPGRWRAASRCWPRMVRRARRPGSGATS